ncbi:hypothetical protein N6H14_03240 [Paenibacillus sp. CC-CFT747]|nr:hypothetical protein N6H14_03240 [Paenibacillus sp. CC-CFT747]
MNVTENSAVTSAPWDFEQSVFLDDTSLKSFMNPDHEHYVKARSFFLDLDDLDRTFVTTSYIVFDTHDWLRNNFGYTQAEFFLNTIEKAISRGKIEVISGNERLEQEAKKLLLQFPDCQFSLGEAVTAVVMLTYRIKRIFTFNRNFQSLTNLYDQIKIIPSTTSA